MAKFQKGQSGNPAGRPKGKMNRSLAREAIVRNWGSLEAFFDAIAEQAKGGDLSAFNHLLSRVEPTLKATAAPIQLELPESATTADAVPVVVKAIAGGELPPDEGSRLLAALLAGSKLEKLDELEKKIDKLMEAKYGNA